MPEDTPSTNKATYTKNDTKMERIFADIIAATLLLSLVIFVGAILIGYMGASAGSVSTVWLTLYAIVVIMGAVRLFGKEALSAAKNAIGGIFKK